MVRIENAWGAYRFQAHPLLVGLESAPSSEDLVVVTIRREAPIELRLMERLKTLPLTAKQRQIAFRLGMGDSPDVVRPGPGYQPGNLPQLCEADVQPA